MMTIGNMRENGVRSLAITCGALCCHHQAVLDVGAFADDVVVPSFGLLDTLAQSAVNLCEADQAVIRQRFCAACRLVAARARR
jgi:hypothetical protein